MYDRNKIVEIAKSFLGATQGDSKHRHIIDTYNKFVSSGKAPGSKYIMKYSDPWCAATVSTCAILAGYTDIIPVECSCTRQIKLLDGMHCYTGNDNYVPQKGDIIYYNWDATSQAQDNGPDGKAHHTGIVESYDDKSGIICVIEGNYNNKCQRRKVGVGWIYIQGYGLPKYEDEPSEIFYTVVPGDCLSKIGAKFGVPWANIAQVNNIKSPYTIYPGQVLKIK